MAQTEFQLKVLTPALELVATQVSEVILPAHDGEVGILAAHGNFVGILGTGVLKYVSKGDDYWLMVSDGVFEVRNGELTVLADVGENAKGVNVDAAKQKELELEKVVFEKIAMYPDSGYNRSESARARPLIGARRRTELH